MSYHSLTILPVSEIYGPVIQGEGEVIGRPTVFVRLGGCDYRCSWCDTPHAVLPAYKDTWEKMFPAELVERVEALAGPPCLVTFSGGNPALYNLEVPVLALGTRGYLTALETQGTRAPDWLRHLDYLTISPKPPSSGHRTTPEQVQACIRAAKHTPIISLKVVVFDEHDYRYAQQIHSACGVPMILQVGNLTPDPGTAPDPLALLESLEGLQRKVLEDRWYNVRVLPQLHTLIHGNRRGT